ncbi:uncharacterized mitochondrial protein-like protein [Tanacetum coccineum]
METSKPLLKDAEAEYVDVHLYRSMIGLLMYLTSSMPDISYSDSDYASASLDRKSTTRGCQFLGSRLISWQCKKQTVVANSTTEAEYVAAATADDAIQVSTVDLTYYYALTVNPIIYTTSIEQFWAIAKVKKVNRERQIQALVDKKRVIITEKSIRSDVMLEDAEGTECLPNDVIFEQITLMSDKTTAWNKFSSTMALVVICLFTNQKSNFFKYIFDNMVKNLEGGVKLLMYPRFVQVFLDKQVEGMAKHKEIYVTPCHTKKVFANIKREGKGFSRRVTPLFQTMMVQAPKELGEGSEIPTDPQHIPTIIQPSTSQPQKKLPKRKQRKDTEVPQPSGSTKPITDEAANKEHVPTHSNDPLFSSEDRLQLMELLKLYTKLSERVLDLENTKTSQAVEITKLKERVKKLERRNKSRTSGLKRLRKEDASKQGRKIANLDADAEEVEVEKAVSIAEVTTVSATTTTVDELTLAQTLIEIKAAKPKAITTAATTTTTAGDNTKAE